MTHWEFIFFSERANFGRFGIVKKTSKIMRKKLMTGGEMNSENERRVQNEMKVKCSEDEDENKGSMQ